jgi:hypothetical protein
MELKEGPTRRKLREDLMHEARDRLHRWMDDTMSRCQIAQLSSGDAQQIALTCLLALIIGGFLSMEVKLEDFLILMQKYYTEAMKADKENSDGVIRH